MGGAKEGWTNRGAGLEGRAVCLSKCFTRRIAGFPVPTDDLIPGVLVVDGPS